MSQLARRSGAAEVESVHVHVVGTLERGALEEIARRGDAAWQRVRDVWGSAPPARVPLVAPATSTEFAALLGRRPEQLGETAALTVGPRSPGSAARIDQIVLHPDAWRTASDVGRDVLLRHELTHVAVRAGTTAATPVWLDEGFAQYVAFLDVPMSPRRLTGGFLEDVARRGPPSRLPAADDFATPGEARESAYAASWFACRVIVAERGQEALVRAVREGRTEASGLSAAELTRRWQQALRGQALEQARR